mmetsp:Transcript_37295/g.64712  ORF Transcript_37295/g.64712 Transcript_37295/m.64712 type:complete len:84 (-) Transcript_37295:49-300(-)
MLETESTLHLPFIVEGRRFGTPSILTTFLARIHHLLDSGGGNFLKFVEAISISKAKADLGKKVLKFEESKKPKPPISDDFKVC